MFIAAIALVQSLFGLLPDEAQAELTRCGVDAEELDSFLAMDQQSFDQDFFGGWREVQAREGCATGAAELIKAYILYSKPTEPKNLGILRWHAGQVYAGEGRTDEAVAFFRGTYNEVEGDQDRAWNFYVDATLAFLAGDREGLVKARDALAEIPVSEEEKAARQEFLDNNPNVTMPDGFLDQPMNLSVVNDLLDCFGRSYEKAYGADDCDR